MRRSRASRSDDRYRRRFLTSLAAVLCLGIAVVQWWPIPDSPSTEGPFRDAGPDRIQVKDIQPTTQTQELTPPPPAPVPPVVVPNDAPIEEEIEFGTSSISVANPGDDRRLQDGSTKAPPTGQQPDTSPRLFRAVQPEYPSAAQENSVQARVRVAVQVSKTGRVEGATILKRWRLSSSGDARPVSHLKYGLEKAALVAARRSRFRPAQEDGAPVASQTTITFEFGASQN